MGKFQVGILGGFEGKVGTVVGGRWKGIDYMRHKGRKSKKPFTLAQLDQQAKFSLVSKFIATLNKLLMKSFRDTPGLTGTNVAFKYNFDTAIIGIYPAYDLDYTKILISKGELHNGQLPTAVAGAPGIVQFNWTDNSGNTFANTDDNAIMVVYCPELSQSVYTKTGPERNAATAALNVSNFSGKTVQTWLSFISADGLTYATSIFTGEVIVG
jgi:hypothetical protein